MKLEVGKYYRTRNGRKVGPMQNTNGRNLRADDGEYYKWDGLGTSQFYTVSGEADDGSAYDIISEWTDKTYTITIPAKAAIHIDDAKLIKDDANPNKYARKINGASVDVYDILRAFGVTCPAAQHAIKKLLMPGQRGGKTKAQDLREALASVHRAIELEDGK
jgi:hypothetical protein